MPKYVYKCEECEGNFTIVHGMTEKQEKCELCLSSDCLIRVPQMTYIKTFESVSEQRSVGSHVKEAIKENAELLKEMKREAITEDFDDGK